MKMVKSLLLGTAALVAGSFAAQAADLAAAEPVEYVKVCDAYGVGYFFIPGSSDTCLRISGYVRAYVAYQARNIGNDQSRGAARAQGGDGFGNGATETIAPVLVNPINPLTGVAAVGTQIGGPINYATYGINSAALLGAAGGNLVVRGNAEQRDQYVSSIRALLRFDARTKTEFGILRSFFEFAANSNNSAKNGDPLLVRYGFVQFGPITAGVTDSFFNYDLSESALSPVGDRATRTPTFAYTASLGNGLSVTLAAEDPTVSEGVGGSTNAITSGTGSAWSRRSNQVPDGVLAVRLVQAWGKLQASAVVSQQRFANTTCTLFVTGVCTRNEIGWAVLGGATINLPFIAKGDSFLVKATYAEGALNYLGNFTSRGYIGNGVAGLDNTITRQSGWSVFGQFVHYFTPAVQLSIFGGYGRLSGDPSAAFGGNLANLRDAYSIHGQLFWTPIAGLTLGTEIFYQGVSFNYFGGPALGNRVLARAGDDSWAGFFRIQRAF